MNTRILFLALAPIVLAGVVVRAAPLGTAFSYQGRLQDGTNAANGLYDLRFAVYDAASAGNQVGPALTNNAVGVTNGLFTVLLDFGPNVFGGQARWLESAVRANGVGAFSLLPPRERLTATPYALYATNAGVALGVAAGGVTAAALAPDAVSADHIASGQVVKSLNGLADNVTLSPGANVNFTTNGHTLTVSAATGGTNSAWNLTGNAGTTPGLNFLGTADAQPLELWVNGWRALRLEPTTFDGAPNLIAGYGGRAGNFVAAGVVGATIGGGGGISYSTPGGSTIYNNNRVGGDYGVVAGGMRNVVNGAEGVISGGQGNTVQAQGVFAAIPGGDQNFANGANSLAAGHRAQALHDGSFVWADSTDGDFASSGTNQFLIRAGGGVGIGTANPQGSLHVASGASTDLRFTSTAGGAGDWSWGTGWTGAGRRSAYLYDYAAAATRFLVDESGNVGIGARPRYPLDVWAAQAAGRFVSSNMDKGSLLELCNNHPSATTLGAINFNNQAGACPGQVAYQSNGVMTFRVAGVDSQMTLDAGGLEVQGGLVCSNLFLPLQNGSSGSICFGGFPIIHSDSSGNFCAGPEAGPVLDPRPALDNTAVGGQALWACTNGTGNTAIGFGALRWLQHGLANIALGNGAGAAFASGSYNIDIGNPGEYWDTGIIRIGIPGVQVETYIAGILDNFIGAGYQPVIVDQYGQLGTLASSRRFKQDIHNMGDASEVLLSLRPVKFHYKSDSKGITQFGLVAEEVDQVDPDLVVRDKNGEPASVRYEAVNVMLLNEFLKQHRQVHDHKQELTAQAAEIQWLRREHESLERRLSKLEACVGQLTADEK